MKVIYVILFGMVIFNAVLIATNEIGVFQYGYEEKDSDSWGYGSYAESSGLLVGVFTSVGLVVGTMVAWVSKSPVPIGAGAFIGFCLGMWSKTYLLLEHLSVPNALLGISTAAMGVLFVFVVIDIMSMQGE